MIFVLLGFIQVPLKSAKNIPVSFSGLSFWPSLKIFMFADTKLKSGY